MYDRPTIGLDFLPLTDDEKERFVSPSLIDDDEEEEEDGDGEY